MNPNNPIRSEGAPGAADANFYGAFGDYEKSIQNRKFQMAQTEDTISNLRAAVEEAEKRNEQLRQKCDTLELEAQVEENRYQSEYQRKIKMEQEYADLEREYMEICESREKIEARMERHNNIHQSCIAMLQNTELDYQAQYAQIPCVAELMQHADEVQNMEMALGEKNVELEDKEESLRQANQQSWEDWKTFQKNCVGLAENLKRIDIAKGELENFKQVADRDEVRNEPLRKPKRSPFMSGGNYMTDFSRCSPMRSPSTSSSTRVKEMLAMFKNFPVPASPARVAKLPPVTSIAVGKRKSLASGYSTLHVQRVQPPAQQEQSATIYEISRDKDIFKVPRVQPTAQQDKSAAIYEISSDGGTYKAPPTTQQEKSAAVYEISSDEGIFKAPPPAQQEKSVAVYEISGDEGFKAPRPAPQQQFSTIYEISSDEGIFKAPPHTQQPLNELLVNDSASNAPLLHPLQTSTSESSMDDFFTNFGVGSGRSSGFDFLNSSGSSNFNFFN